MSGAFIPLSEDGAVADAAAKGHLALEKLEAMTSVCSVGLDMIAIPGDTPPETISAVIADEMAIGVMNNKTTGVRLIPVPGTSPATASNSEASSAPPTSWTFATPARHRVRAIRQAHPRAHPVAPELIDRNWIGIGLCACFRTDPTGWWVAGKAFLFSRTVGKRVQQDALHRGIG